MNNDRQKERDAGSGMLMQAGILATAGIIVRIIGLLYRSPLTGIIGDEGNGYYNYAYNCYALILLISAYSIPSAISKVIAGKLALGEERNAERIFHAALIYVTIVSGAFALFVFFGANLLTYGNSVTVLRVFSPTILIFGYLGVLRGAFQARGTMVPTSVSQILEQIANAVVSILAAYLFIRSAGPEADDTTRAVRGAVGSALGTGAGVLVALLFMLLAFFSARPMIKYRVRQDTHQTVEPWGKVILLLFFTVTPFILSTFIYNFSTMLNQTVFQRILIHLRGATESEVAIAYGIFSTKAVVIANIPIALSNAMSSAMMPNLSARYAKKDVEGATGLVEQALKTTLFVSIPCAVGLIVLARPIMMVLFPQRNSLDEAAGLLAGIAVTVVLYSVSTVTNAVLQGIGKMNLPVVNALLALTVQGVVLTLLLIYTPLHNGALVIAMILYSALMCLLNQRATRRFLPVKIHMKRMLVMPAFGAAVMGAGAFLVHFVVFRLASMVIEREYFANFIALLPALLVAVEIYGLLLVRLRVVTRKELLRMPKGHAIVKFLSKLRVLPAEEEEKRG